MQSPITSPPSSRIETEVRRIGALLGRGEFAQALQASICSREFFEARKGFGCEGVNQGRHFEPWLEPLKADLGSHIECAGQRRRSRCESD
jgi:hypothetical protein